MVRPRIVTPPPEEMIELGEKMLQWVKDKNPLHLSEWYSGEMFIVDHVWQTMHETAEFLPYYNKALKMISIKYLDGTVNASIAQRWLRLYFKDLKRIEDADKKEEAELKRLVELSTPPTQTEIDKDDIIMRLTHENAKLRRKLPVDSQ